MLRILCSLLLLGGLFAADPAPGPEAGPEAEAKPAAPRRQLTFLSGSVTLGEHLATIALPADCRFLAGDEARYWVQEVWHNPPNQRVIGLVLPAELAERYEQRRNAPPGTPRPEYTGRSWGMVVNWGGDTGHVADDDARATDFDALLKQMQEATKEANPEREKAGYGHIDLLGWAEPPHYDAAAKKLYWAKSLRFNQEPTPTLNYCVRLLGARGVLELNAVDDLPALASLTASAQQVLTATEFTAGNRYEDFKSGIDPVAAGGIAALIVGGVVAKKIGLIAVFGVFLLKFIKILFIPAIFLFGWLAKFFKRSREAKADARAQSLRDEDARVARMRSEQGRAETTASDS
jgi:uncharacterized membrane-anchored protein